MAQGRVWTGQQALDRGLVDALGNLQDAVKAAKQLAKLEDSAAVRYIENEESEYDWFLQKLLGTQLWGGVLSSLEGLVPTALKPELKQLPYEALRLQRLVKPEQPFNGVAHCLCEARL